MNKLILDIPTSPLSKPFMFVSCNHCKSKFANDRYLNYHKNFECVTRITACKIKKGNNHRAVERNNERVEPSPRTVATHISSDHTDSYILYIGGLVKPDSLIGGSAWLLLNNSHHKVATGSNHVILNFPSLIRLEYEGLLNGLKATYYKGIRKLIIKSSSSYLITDCLNKNTYIHPYLTTINHDLTHIKQVINNLLLQFYEIKFDLINIEQNKRVVKQALNVLNQYNYNKYNNISNIQLTPYASNNTNSNSTSSVYSTTNNNNINSTNSNNTAAIQQQSTYPTYSNNSYTSVYSNPNTYNITNTDTYYDNVYANKNTDHNYATYDLFKK